jgi:hypothetical protein
VEIKGIKGVFVYGDKVLIKCETSGGELSFSVPIINFPYFAYIIQEAKEKIKDLNPLPNLKIQDEISLLNIYLTYAIPHKILGDEKTFRKKMKEIFEFQKNQGLINRITIVQSILDKLSKPRTYLEIGVERGFTFYQIQAEKKIAVDPEFKIPGGFKNTESEIFFQLTSDEFFENYAEDFGEDPFDVILIDGLHTFEQSRRDVENSLKFLSSRGVIVMHDCLPKSYPSSLKSLADAVKHPEFDGSWSGDVYKTIIYLRAKRKDLFVAVVDSDHGVGIVKYGEPENMIDIEEDKIEQIDFFELMKRKEELLNIKPPDWFKIWIEKL